MTSNTPKNSPNNWFIKLNRFKKSFVKSTLFVTASVVGAFVNICNCISRTFTSVIKFLGGSIVWFLLAFIISGFISLPALPFLLGKSTHLRCVRLEINYAECQLTRAHFYDLFKEQSVPIILTDTIIETSEDIDNESGVSRTYYSLYINKNSPILLRYYRTDGDIAYQDKQRIDEFLAGVNETSFNFKTSINAWSELFLIPEGAVYTVLGLFILGIIYFMIIFLSGVLLKRR